MLRGDGGDENRDATIREVSGDEFPPWFDAEPQITKDAVLGATTAAQSYLDTGAIVYPPLTIRAAFASSSARETFITANLLQSGTLANTRSRSATALLVKAVRLDALPRYLADLTFELR